MAQEEYYNPAPATVVKLVACLGLVIAPHLFRMPLWASLVVVTVGLWRIAAALRGWPLPGRVLRLSLAVVACGAVYLDYGTLNGQYPGVALLVVMSALKLTEMQRRRDYFVVAFLGYFVLITHFLFSQEMVMLPYLFLSTLAVTAVLMELNHPQSALPLRKTLRGAGILMLQAGPLMLIFFILFPRIPGPLWGLPSDAGAARSGLSDSMEPGSIAALALSDEIAFRVRFVDSPPPNNQMYWRGPVFWHFDGRAWSGQEEPAAVRPTDNSFLGEPIRQEITLEPHRARWLLALDVPVSGPNDAFFGRGYQMWAKQPVKERRLYQVASHTQYRIDTELHSWIRRRALQLPAGGNDRSRTLAEDWRNAGLSDAQIIDRALQRFRQQEYFYTLQPPALGRDSVDEFLFDSRRGFCEHYASAFTFLMRAAGVPARVITGYQGVERNELGGYYIVRQADAHAWSEVWLANRGWVRIDPTAAVAPIRIEQGLTAALPASESALSGGRVRMSTNLRYTLEMYRDLANAHWNRWFLAYGMDIQQDFLSLFGMNRHRDMILALTFLTVGFLAALGAFLILQTRPGLPEDPAARQWFRFCRKLARIGIVREPHEGPQDYAARARARYPELAPQIDAVTRAYIRLRYGRGGEGMDAFKRLVRDFRPRRRPIHS